MFKVWSLVKVKTFCEPVSPYDFGLSNEDKSTLKHYSEWLTTSTGFNDEWEIKEIFEIDGKIFYLIKKMINRTIVHWPEYIFIESTNVDYLMSVVHTKTTDDVFFMLYVVREVYWIWDKSLTIPPYYWEDTYMSIWHGMNFFKKEHCKNYKILSVNEMLEELKINIPLLMEKYNRYINDIGYLGRDYIKVYYKKLLNSK